MKTARKIGSVHQDAAEFKQRLSDIPALIEALGLGEGAQPQKDGLVIRCPFHDDHNPSCSVFAADGGLGFKCFACPAKGDALSLIAKVNALDIKADFGKVMKIATAIADTIATNGATKVATMVRLDLHEPAQRLLERCPLDGNKAVVAYLEHRGLLAEAAADGWGALPGDAVALASLIADLGADAQTLGLCSSSGLAKHSANVLIIPWHTADGRIDLIQRRTVGSDSSKRYVMPAGYGANAPYGAERVRKTSSPLAIVEGAFDVLGYRKLCALEDIDRDVIGVPGVASWKVEWDALVAGRDVILSFDNDDAGHKGAEQIGPRLRKAGAGEIVRRVPEGAKDWAELVEVLS
jgi:DNA primase